MTGSIRQELEKNFKKAGENLFDSGCSGYWSNLSVEESRSLNAALEKAGTKNAVLTEQPALMDIIFSPKRDAGLEFLGLKGNEACIDYGCMWGAITIGLAKRAGYVLGIDQTRESLLFLQKRLKEERLSNADLLIADLKNGISFENKFDIAVVNGVLEWIPEEGGIELGAYYGRRSKKLYQGDPGKKQLDFLKKVFSGLKSNGKIFLAIENRFDFKMFFGAPDPHARIPFLSLLPRPAANLISRLFLGRPYVNWLYSFRGLKKLLKEAGFSGIEMYMCFPDYRYPEHIIPFGSSLDDFTPTIPIRNSKGRSSIKRYMARLAEYVFFRHLKAGYLAPSIIAIGQKCSNC